MGLPSTSTLSDMADPQNLGELDSFSLGPSVHWVGDRDKSGHLYSNAYILVSGDEAILFDPGSIMDFSVIYQKVSQLIPMEKLKYIVLHNTDSDNCASLSLWENAGFRGSIVTHWRNNRIIKSMGLRSRLYSITDKQSQLKMGEGRLLRFIPTPYVNYPGSMVTYDQLSQTLFTSELFSSDPGIIPFFADTTSVIPLKTWHELNTPDSATLQAVLSFLNQLQIKMICSHHGSIINDNIPYYFHILNNIECGLLINPIKQHNFRKLGYKGVLELIIQRLYELFPDITFSELFFENGIKVDGDNKILDGGTLSDLDMWQNFFRILKNNDPGHWMAVIENYVTRMCFTYDLPLPKFYDEAADSEKMDEINQENEGLKQDKFDLQESIILANDDLIRDPVTDFYNENFFFEYMRILMTESDRGAILFIRIDDIRNLNAIYGAQSGDKTIKSLGYLLLNHKGPEDILFRMNGPVCAYFMPGAGKEEGITRANALRLEVERAEVFIQKLTVSLAVVTFHEIKDHVISEENHVKTLLTTGKERLKILDRMGFNSICSESKINDFKEASGAVLILENDMFQAQMMKEHLEKENLDVHICLRGGEALDMIDEHKPDIIISEIFLSQMDAFQLRQRMKLSPDLKDVPFVLVSRQKTEATVIRALSLEITHYFKKPYMLVEFIGTVKNIIRQLRLHGS